MPRLVLLVGCALALPFAAASAGQSPIPCESLIFGRQDIGAIASGIFCAAGDCGVLDVNDDGSISAADLVGGLSLIGSCEVPERRGSLTVAEGGDPQGYLILNRYGTATPEADGDFTVRHAENVPTFTYALSETGEAYAAFSFDDGGRLRIDALSTARALLAINPLFIPGDPTEHLDLWEAILGSPEVEQLAAAIEAAYSDGRDLSEDPLVESALELAVLAVLSGLDEDAGARVSGVGPLGPGECGRPGTLRVCNFDMVNLTLAGSFGQTLRIEPATEGFLGLRTNVDWAARVVELDSQRLPTDGDKYLFFPDSVDSYIKQGGFDQEVYVRGAVAGGKLRFLVDPVAYIASRWIRGDVLRSGGSLLLDEPGVYAVVAISGSWANDREEYLAVLGSPWQRALNLDAIRLNLIALVLDMATFALPIASAGLVEVPGAAGSVGLLDAIGSLRPLTDVTVAAIRNDPGSAADAIDRFLVSGMGELSLIWAETLALKSGQHLAQETLTRLALKPVSKALSVWSSGIRISTRLGGLASVVSPRESGYAIFSPARMVIDSIGIPADGTVVDTTAALAVGVTYRVVVTGPYRYDTGERGEFADAQYRENDRDEYEIRYNSVVFDGERLDAVAAESDRSASRHVFYFVGRGAPLSLQIYDTNYRDNEGSLRAEIFAPGS